MVTSGHSPHELKLIAEIFSADGGKDRFILAEECHRDFPEWQDPGDTSTPIDISDIVAAREPILKSCRHVATALISMFSGPPLTWRPRTWTSTPAKRSFIPSAMKIAERIFGLSPPNPTPTASS